MKVKHYKITKPKRLISEMNGWKQAWHGYYRLEEATRHELEVTSQERTLEVDCLLSIVEDISKRRKQHINLIELGAGWGENCMALAGIVDFKLILHNIKSYSYLAVEAEPYYYELIEKHFVMNDLPIKILHAAVSDKMGSCRYNRFTSPNSYYGQGMTFNGNFSGSKLKTMALAGYYLLMGKTVKVPMITVDRLLSKYSTQFKKRASEILREKHMRNNEVSNLPSRDRVLFAIQEMQEELLNHKAKVDIIQCDVQGVEDKVIKGAMESIRQGRIDYWLIGTHHKKLNEKCRRMLEPYYDCVVDVMPSKEKRLGLNQDGTQLFRRKGL
jgi:hypothetical protein